MPDRPDRAVIELRGCGCTFSLLLGLGLLFSLFPMCG